MKFEYLKIYKNGDRSVGYIDSPSIESAKSKIKQLSPLTFNLVSVYSLHGLDIRSFVAAVHYLDLSRLELIWEAQNVSIRNF